MKDQMLERFSFPKNLKEELVSLVFYKGMDAKDVAEKYGLPSVHMLANWIKLYKKKLEAGAITLAPMEKKTKVKAAVLTPNQAHSTEEPLIKHWKNRRKNIKDQGGKEIVFT